MGKSRKPTRVLELKGAFDKDPQRRRPHEPQVDEPLGGPPDCLDEAERARWEEIRADCYWLNCTHRGLVEQTCRLIMLDRNRKAGVGEMKLLQSNWRCLGMTPVDSSKVVAPPKGEGEKNPYEEMA